MAGAQAVAAGIELDMAWEFAPEGDFAFADLARDYFSEQATLEQQAGTLMALYEAPHYFRRAGKGKFRKASADILAQALAAIEKKKQIGLQIEAWVNDLSTGACPQPIRDQLYKILFKPDKNAPEYKAVVEASRASHLGPLELLIKAGAIDSPYQFHWKRFLLENFPKGTAFPKLDAPLITDQLPLSGARAFSIDDSATTEIDDALSVQDLGTGAVVVGIHIAAPALAIAPNSAVDHVGRARLSTVYMPGYKLTMLPDEVVQKYTLMEGQDCPAVSLYVTLDEATLEIKASETKLERVHIGANLRHDQLDSVVTTAWLEDPSFEHNIDPKPLLNKREQLSFLYRLAKDLKAKREVVRGKPENFNRPDYNFRLAGNEGREPQGQEQVLISTRQRGAPLDLIVAEAMILANSHWGGWLAQCGVPGIYRSQAALAPGVKVRMGTRPAVHAGMGVAQYTWASSPLRRYVDLVNQWQIIACARHGRTAALAAPFKPKDAALLSIISGFDAAYASYNDFQNTIERYWTLRWLQQNEVGELDAAVMKDGLVRADTLPLVFRVPGTEALPRGARVRARVAGIDLLTLELHAQLLARIEAASAAPDATDEPEAEDESPDAGALRLAIELEAPIADAAAAAAAANAAAPAAQA